MHALTVISHLWPKSIYCIVGKRVDEEALSMSVLCGTLRGLKWQLMSLTWDELMGVGGGCKMAVDIFFFFLNLISAAAQFSSRKKLILLLRFFSLILCLVYIKII